MIKNIWDNVKNIVNKIKESNNIKKTIIVIAGIIVLTYVVYSIYKLVREPTDTFTLETGKLYSEESVTGYIIRDETVIQGENYKNGIVQIKTEGEKVAKDEAIFRYYSNNEESLTKKIEELDVKIQEALNNETNLFSNDTKMLERQIDDKIIELSDINDIQKINEYKKDINTAVTKKAKIAGELSPTGSYIRKLIEERSSYENKLNSGSEYVKSTTSGIVSYRIDGLENVLTPKDFSKLSRNMLEELNLKTGQMISSSKESGKIIDNFKCYIATVMNSERAKEVKEGDKLKIRLSNTKEISAKVHYVTDETDGSKLIVFEINDEVEELTNYRKISFDVIWWSAEGLKVPTSALIEEGDLKYVVRNRAGYLDKILVKVLKQNDNYAILDNYSTDELKELGYTSKEIWSSKGINLHDEIMINANKTK